jgi:large subunit ribosomal protein L16
MNGVTEELAREAFRLAAHKLPIHTKFVSRTEQQEAAAAAAEGGSNEN